MAFDEHTKARYNNILFVIMYVRVNFELYQYSKLLIADIGLRALILRFGKND